MLDAHRAGLPAVRTWQADSIILAVGGHGNVEHLDVAAADVADGRPDGFCKLIVDAGQRYILGAHVLGEYSVEVIQGHPDGGSTYGTGNAVVQVAELPLTNPICTEAVGLAARQLVRELGVAPLMPTADAIEPLYI